MRNTGRWLVVAFLVMGVLVTPVFLHAQGRISGLRISNSSIVGTTLSFDVTLSIDVPAGSPDLGFLGDHYHQSHSTTWISTTMRTTTRTITTTYPCSTMTLTHHDTCTGPPPTSSTYPCNTTTYTSHNTCTNFSTHTYPITYSYFNTTEYISGHTLLTPRIPAVDWGDGVTIQRTTLPLVGSGTTHVYRRSFSHTYASTGDYNVRVGAFGQDIAPTLNGGQLVTVNNPDTFQIRSYQRTNYEHSGSWMSSDSNSATQTVSSPHNSPVGVTATSSFGVPVELKSFTVADASGSFEPAHRVSPLQTAGLGFGSVLAILGFALLKKK